jgi:hypothetical protein
MAGEDRVLRQSAVAGAIEEMLFTGGALTPGCWVQPAPVSRVGPRHCGLPVSSASVTGFCYSSLPV